MGLSREQVLEALDGAEAATGQRPTRVVVGAEVPDAEVELLESAGLEVARAPRREITGAEIAAALTRGR